MKNTSRGALAVSAVLLALFGSFSVANAKNKGPKPPPVVEPSGAKHCTIDGTDGNDVIIPSPVVDGDIICGHRGNDLIIVPPHSGTVDVSGGDDSDLLCILNGSKERYAGDGEIDGSQRDSTDDPAKDKKTQNKHGAPGTEIQIPEQDSCPPGQNT